MSPRNRPGPTRSGGAWRRIGRLFGLLTGHERRVGYGPMMPSSPCRNVTVGGIRVVVSIEIAILDSDCEPGLSRRPPNDEIQVHRSGLSRMTPPIPGHFTGQGIRDSPSRGADLTWSVAARGSACGTPN